MARNFRSLIDGLRRELDGPPVRRGEENGGNIPVRKLYVNAVRRYPDSVDQVMYVFKQYGDLHSVLLRPDRVFFFVMFIHPESAQRALADKDRLWRTRKLSVKPADQWHQPLELADGSIIWDRRNIDTAAEIRSLYGTSVEREGDPYKPDAPSLMDLDDDVLLLILRKLTLKELIGIERVSMRIRSLCLSRWAAITSLCLSKDFPTVNDSCIDHLREILLRCGSNLRELDLSPAKRPIDTLFTRPPQTLSRITHQIAKLCPNLKSLNIYHFQVKLVHLAPIETIIQQLTSLSMGGCAIDRDVIQFVAKHGVNLESLEMGGSELCQLNDLAGSVSPFLKLKKLKMDKTIISYHSIVTTYPNVTDLECANIIYNKVRSNKDDELPLSKITRLCVNNLGAVHLDIGFLDKMPHLEFLVVSTTDFVSTSCDGLVAKILTFKSLKHLEILHNGSLTDSHVVDIANNMAGRLEYFSCHHSSLVSSSSLLKLIDANLMTLRHIDVSGSHVDSVPSFLQEVDKKVRSRFNSLPVPLIVSVESGDTRVWPEDDLHVQVHFNEGDNCHSCLESINDALDDIYDESDDNDDDIDYNFDVDWEDEDMMMACALRAAYDSDSSPPAWLDYLPGGYYDDCI